MELCSIACAETVGYFPAAGLVNQRRGRSPLPSSLKNQKLTSSSTTEAASLMSVSNRSNVVSPGRAASHLATGELSPETVIVPVPFSEVKDIVTETASGVSEEIAAVVGGAAVAVVVGIVAAVTATVGGTAGVFPLSPPLLEQAEAVKSQNCYRCCTYSEPSPRT